MPDPPRPRPTLTSVRDRLRALLPSAELVDEGDEPPGRRSLAMFLSLVVALVMWFSFSMRETYPLTMRMPVVIAQTPPGSALRSRPPEVATVTLRGEGWTLLSLTRRTPTITVDAESRVVSLAAALSELGLPDGIEVQAVTPQAVELDLDTETNRRLPIRLRERIGTEVGFDLLRPPRLSPDSVTVTGAQSLLGTLDSWPTDLLVARDVEDSFTRIVALADTFGGLLRPSVEATRVQVDVGEFTEGFRDLQVEVENVPPGVLGVRFDPPRVRAVFRVPAAGDTYDRALNSPRVRAVVDFFDIARDTTRQDGQVPVSPRWPDNLDIRNVTLQPARVGYFIQRPAAPEPGDGGE
ncbi:CdaR family protein [Rubrivirga marina]|uniref:YbbR-like domain-containing protein n=1 Tax=Rubrivirga marina TaxID=1196024 RepID=A0A271J4K4_9BACT|nr:hypothetical protein [Rubrivirga marina]PAP78228.1 hypothetical protein BSZ37_18245 [Rubrivirga marina]